VDDVLKEAVNKNMFVLNLLEALGETAKTEEIKEGMEADGDGDEAEYDEHVWLSLRNATRLCAIISVFISALDTDNAVAYSANLEAYAMELSALDTAFSADVADAPVRTLLFGDRFPFRYLVDDYGLDYYAAFAGCSAETEASFGTIIYLAGIIDRLHLKSIIVTESSNQSIAKTIRDNTAWKNQQIVVFDSMQSVALKDIENGATYLSIMEGNLAALREALELVAHYA
jgi:zinc transport system substrate-binding protein